MKIIPVNENTVIIYFADKVSIEIAEKVLRAELTGDKQKELIEASIKDANLN
mgnify:CR=1 FL=1